MTNELHTATEVIDALGGLNAVASMFNVGYTAAHNWKASGQFPARKYAAMAAALRERGHTAPASLWGMVEAA